MIGEADVGLTARVYIAADAENRHSLQRNLSSIAAPYANGSDSSIGVLVN